MRADAHKPWLGLAAYEEGDQPFFHGRRAEAAELCALVEREPLSVLYGVSGLGKTSLVHAGLFPKLRLEDYLPVYLRLRHDAPQSGESPIGGTLAEQVFDAVSPSAELKRSGEWSSGTRPTLWEWFHHRDLCFWSVKNRLLVPVLVFDQFEEVFTLGQQTPERAARTAIFLEEVSALVYNRPPASVESALARGEDVPFEFENVPLRVLLSLREDFLPHLAGLRDRGFSTIRRNEMRLLPMEAVAAREVIEIPGRDLLEEGVPDQILAFVLGEEGGTVEPALLSLVLRELNEERDLEGLPRITASLLSGNKNEILNEFYESAFEAVEAGVRTFVESELVSPGGFRDSRALDYALARPGVTQAALDTLVDRRLLRLEDRAAGARRVELTHDLLCGVATASRAARLAARQRRKVRRAWILVAVLGIVSVLSALFAIRSRQKARDGASAFGREGIREKLVQAINQRTQEEIAKYDPVRDRAKISALQKLRDQQLADVDPSLDRVEQTFKKNEVSANYNQALHILTKRGVPEALRFLAANGPVREKNLEVLSLAKDRAEKNLRSLLQEKVLSASLLKNAAQLDEAEAEYRAVVRDGGTWAEPRTALAELLMDRGEVIDPKAGNAKLRDAAELCRGTLAANSRAADPTAWAAAQRTLADVLASQARRAAGAESQRLLREAVEAYRTALGVYTPEQYPKEWAKTQNNLGLALQGQGTRAEGEEGRLLLDEAVTAFRAALQIYQRDRSPKDWARTQTNLGATLADQGARAGGPEGAHLLDQAVMAFREALTVYRQNKPPQDWAGVQNNLGTALRALSERTDQGDGPSLLAQAVTAFEEALKVYQQSSAPQDWARTQYNLGRALHDQATRADEGERQRLRQNAVAAFGAALEVYQKDELPQAWATTQNSLGIALGALGTSTDGAEGRRQLGEAATAFRSALEVYQRDQLPKEWANTQNSLGTALLKQGTRAEGKEGRQLLNEAVTAFRAALEVYTRDQLPQDWAWTQNSLGAALMVQGTRADETEGQRLLGDAVAAFRAALEVYTREQSPSDWRKTQENLAGALRALSTRSKGPEAARLPAEAKRIENELAAPR